MFKREFYGTLRVTEFVHFVVFELCYQARCSSEILQMKTKTPHPTLGTPLHLFRNNEFIIPPLKPKMVVIAKFVTSNCFSLWNKAPF